MVSAFSVPKATRGTPLLIKMKSSPKIQAPDSISTPLPTQPRTQSQTCQTLRSSLQVLPPPPSFGKDIRKSEGNINPGPGAYEPKAQFVKDVPPVSPSKNRPSPC